MAVFSMFGGDVCAGQQRASATTLVWAQPAPAHDELGPPAYTGCPPDSVWISQIVSVSSASVRSRSHGPRASHRYSPTDHPELITHERVAKTVTSACSQRRPWPTIYKIEKWSIYPLRKQAKTWRMLAYRTGTLCSVDDSLLVMTIGNFETEEHRNEFIDHLARRILPLKFAFAGSATLTYDQFGLSSGYQQVVDATVPEVEALLSVLRKNPTTRVVRQICEVGPGNGIHTRAFLRQLHRRGIDPARYLGLDFSLTLLHLAASRIPHELPLQITLKTWDFERHPSLAISKWRKPEDPVLVLLLGHTLGNPEDPVRALRNLRQSCTTGDYLLLSVALHTNSVTVDEVLAPYQTEAFRLAAIEPLRIVGLPTRGIAVDLTFTGRTVIGRIKVPCSSAILGVHLKKNEIITVFRSNASLLMNSWRYCTKAVGELGLANSIQREDI